MVEKNPATPVAKRVYNTYIHPSEFMGGWNSKVTFAWFRMKLQSRFSALLDFRSLALSRIDSHAIATSQGNWSSPCLFSCDRFDISRDPKTTTCSWYGQIDNRRRPLLTEDIRLSPSARFKSSNCIIMNGTNSVFLSAGLVHIADQSLASVVMTSVSLLG